MIVAAVAFCLLTASVDVGLARINGVVDQNWRGTYDLLVLPAGSSPASSSGHLVEVNYLSTATGGITSTQYSRIEKQPGVGVAAPLEIVGYVLETALIYVGMSAVAGPSGESARSVHARSPRILRLPPPGSLGRVAARPSRGGRIRQAVMDPSRLPDMSYRCGYDHRMATPRWLDKDEQAAWTAYRQMNRALYADLARDLTRDTGLSDPDYEVLSTLSESASPSLRASELGLLLQWSTSRVAHHIGRMERRGLVRRVACEDDGRGAIIQLTKLGLRTIEKAAPHHVAAVRRRFIGPLTPEQLSALRGIARTITSHLIDMESER